MITLRTRLLATVMTMLSLSSIPLAALATPDAHAEPAIVVEGAPDIVLPAERAVAIRAALARALAGRCPPGVSVRLIIGRHDTDLEVSGLHRRLPGLLGESDRGTSTTDDARAEGQQGEQETDRKEGAALRLLALLALDLMQPATDLGRITPPPAPAVIATAEAAAVPTAAPRHWSVMLSGALHAATETTVPHTTGGALGTGMAWRALRTGLEAAWDYAGPSNPGSVTAATYNAWSLRLRAAAAFGPAELGVRAGAVVRRIDAAREVTSTTPVLGPYAALRLPIAWRVSAWLEAGADFFTHRTTLSLGSNVVFSTPQLAPFAALGVVVEVAP